MADFLEGKRSEANCPKMDGGENPIPDRKSGSFFFPEKVATCSLFDPSLTTDSLKKTLLAFLYTHFFRFFLPSFSICPPFSHKIIKLDLDIVFSSPCSSLAADFYGQYWRIDGLHSLLSPDKKGSRKNLTNKKMADFFSFTQQTNCQTSNPSTDLGFLVFVLVSPPFSFHQIKIDCLSLWGSFFTNLIRSSVYICGKRRFFFSLKWVPRRKVKYNLHRQTVFFSHDIIRNIYCNSVIWKQFKCFLHIWGNASFFQCSWGAHLVLPFPNGQHVISLLRLLMVECLGSMQIILLCRCDKFFRREEMVGRTVLEIKKDRRKNRNLASKKKNHAKLFSWLKLR